MRFGRVNRRRTALTICGLWLLLALPVRADEPLDDILDAEVIGNGSVYCVGPRGQAARFDADGERWTRAAIATHGDLHAVQFLDGRQGWMAGGWTHPYTHRSTGVLYRTSDGGRTWRELTGALLPKIRDVHFFDEKNGWAITEPSPLYPAGVAWTRDGGRRWAAAPLPYGGGVKCAAFCSPNRMIAVLRGGDVLIVTLSDAVPARLLPQAGRNALAACAEGDRVWLVGAEGMILRSDDGGEHWADCSLPPEIGADFQLSTVRSRGGQCWVAGAPGSRVFTTDDHGGHWRRWTTPQSLPITALAPDASGGGWLATATGGLYSTNDLSKGWLVQAPGGGRAVVLAIQVGDLISPAGWEAVARYGAEDGYVAAWELWRSRPGDIEETLGESRWMEAARSLHAHARPFVVRDQGPEFSESARLQLERAIRQWRPEILVLTGGDAARYADASRKAAERAASPVNDARWTALGLEPWRVKRIAAVAGRDGAIVRLSGGRLAPALGQSLGQFVQRARRLMETQYDSPAEQLELSILWNQPGLVPKPDDLMAGITIPSGSPGRRGYDRVARLPELQKRLQARRSVEGLMLQAGRQSPGVLLGQLDRLTESLPPADAGDVLYQLAMTYQREGYADFSTDVLTRIADRHSRHPLAERAAIEVLQRRSGVEARWAKRKGVSSVRQAAVNTPAAPAKLAATTEDRGGVQTAVFQPSLKQRQGMVIPLDEASEDLKLQAWLERLGKRRPELLMESSVRMLIASFDRRAGRIDSARRAWADIERIGEPVWADRARWESELAAGEPSSRPTIVCKFAEEKPRLDAEFGDSLWTSATVSPLRNTSPGRGLEAANIMLAYDDQFLYIAAKAPLKEGERVGGLTGPRRRDDELTKRDHLEILLDVDRDYATSFRLAVDHAGRTHESCHGDPSWDPKWFVAAKQTDTHWAIEAAVSWSGLGPAGPARGDVWLLNMRRRRPDDQQQAWLGAASDASDRDSWGALRFE